jgi:hypothetical protein
MIIIAPWSRALRNGGKNPKNYPWWPQLMNMISEPIIQVGAQDEQQLVNDFRTGLSIDDLKQLLKECKTWISVDTFFQHLAWQEQKPGIVLWGPSDPLIFGHPENVNLLAGREYLVKNQFLMWEQQEYLEDRFVKPNIVIEYLNKF